VLRPLVVGLSRLQRPSPSSQRLCNAPSGPSISERSRLRPCVWTPLPPALFQTGPDCTGLGTPLRRDFVDRSSFKPLLGRAGLPRSTRLHDLWHTCATLLLVRGTHPKLVQELLGHSTIAMTSDRYSHVLPGMGDQTANAMDAALS
jgi:Phage integrase family